MDEELIEEFKNEASESLDEAELSILAIDRGDEFLPNFNKVFRAFHSIKGGAGMLGLEKLQATVHHLENLLDQIKPTGHFPKPLVDYLLQGVDATRRIFNGENVLFEFRNPLVTEAAPAVSLENKPAERSEQLARNLSRGVVYIVDDDEVVLETIWDIVSDLGFQAMKFSDPLKLIDAAKKTPPDVIVTDIKMPQMTGLELLREMHTRAPQIPVILVSGFVSKQAVLDAIGFGAFGIVEKPIVHEVLCTLLLNATRQARLERLIDRSIKFVLYQFSDLDEFLKTTGKDTIRTMIKNEMENLLSMRRELRSVQSDSVKAFRQGA